MEDSSPELILESGLESGSSVLESVLEYRNAVLELALECCRAVLVLGLDFLCSDSTRTRLSCIRSISDGKFQTPMAVMIFMQNP
jgi:hypothetical protein